MNSSDPCAPTRLWFHLEDVMPLAEHAMACPAWELIREDRGDSPRLLPALVWRTIVGQHLLSSYGLPAWHDDNGQIHTVPARTWQHTPTARRGAAPTTSTARMWALNHDQRSSGNRLLRRISQWWPVRHRRDSLITQLREGAARGAHWLAVDVDPVTSSPRFQVVDHRDDIVPAAATWQPSYVTSRAVWYGQYPALIASGYSVHGNGDVIARFSRATLQRMVTHLHAVHASTDPDTDPMPGEVAKLHFDGDVLVVSWSYDNGETEVWTEIDRVHPDGDGYYAVGAFLWLWEPVSVHAYSGREVW